MNLIDLAEEVNLHPKRTSSTNGGEYHSPCPSCQGKDRFIIWDKIGRYWCRQCNCKGDLIQFCRDFLNLDYHEACEKVGAEPKMHLGKRFSHKIFTPQPASIPSREWQEQGMRFASNSHTRMFNTPFGLSIIKNRGFSIHTAQTFILGWNESNKFEAPNLWGFPRTGEKRKIWLPRGIVIPTYENGQLVKLKIRRTDWHPEDTLPKYAEITGSMKAPSIYGNIFDVIVLVESELDAMLLQQIANDLCCCIAIGGVGKKPDIRTDTLLKKSRLILFALDFDEPGKKAYKFWKDTYPHIKPWPVPRGKSPGDAFKEGVNLRQWVEVGMK